MEVSDTDWGFIHQPSLMALHLYSQKLDIKSYFSNFYHSWDHPTEIWVTFIRLRVGNHSTSWEQGPLCPWASRMAMWRLLSIFLQKSSFHSAQPYTPLSQWLPVRGGGILGRMVSTWIASPIYVISEMCSTKGLSKFWKAHRFQSKILRIKQKILHFVLFVLISLVPFSVSIKIVGAGGREREIN